MALRQSLDCYVAWTGKESLAAAEGSPSLGDFPRRAHIWVKLHDPGYMHLPLFHEWHTLLGPSLDGYGVGLLPLGIGGLLFCICAGKPLVRGMRGTMAQMLLSWSVSLQ